jgi:hypothetical protein
MLWVVGFGGLFAEVGVDDEWFVEGCIDIASA